MGIFSIIAIVFVMVQISMAFTSIWLHRGNAHGSVKLNRAVRNFMHLWISSFIMINPRKWISTRLLKKKSDCTQALQARPKAKDFWRILFSALWMYQRSATRDVIKIKSQDFVPDLFEKIRLFWLMRFRGILTFVLFCLFLGWKGAVIWVGQLVGYAFFFGLLNCAGHYWGKPARGLKGLHGHTLYWVLAFLTAGETWHRDFREEKHSACFAKKWWQIDLGYVLILMLQRMGWAKITKSAG